MRVLVVNAGSSSLKLDVLDPESGVRAASARAERVGTAACTATLDGDRVIPLAGADHSAALGALLPHLTASGEITAVGHRCVHGGDRFDAPTRLDDTVIEHIHELADLAPLHVPANLAGIAAARAALPDVLHVAVFDTAFHSTLPRRARAYAIDTDVATAEGVRRYGFHGPSHQWVAHRAAEWLRTDVRDLRLITCHLGSGASVCAVEYGRSIETSMGMTPLEGLVMGTRCGDLDPGVLLHLMRKGWSADEIDHLLQRESGLAGLSGRGADLRDITEGAAEGDAACRLAIHVFAHRVRKYIGAYAAVMGGVDGIVFTAGIGENSALMRHHIAQRLEFLGAHLSEERNREARVDDADPVAPIHTERSRTPLLVVRTDEAWAIGRATSRLAAELDQVAPLSIPVAVSARHVHLTQEAVEALFGEGHQLTPYRDLSQPGQFACEEKVNLIGPKRMIEGVRILGPTRPACQVEISRTDEFFLGVDAPVRNSGDVKNTPGITLEGPNGRLELQEGLICARRHVHMTPADAERFGVRDRDVVEVAINSEGRDLIFGDVLVRVKESYALEMHIDTDEANAAEVRGRMEGMLVGTDATALIRRRSTRFEAR